MVALHIWTMAHGVASLFGRGDGAQRAMPMSPAELLEAGLLVYLRGLGVNARDREGRAAGRSEQAEPASRAKGLDMGCSKVNVHYIHTLRTRHACHSDDLGVSVVVAARIPDSRPHDRARKVRLLASPDLRRRWTDARLGPRQGPL